MKKAKGYWQLGRLGPEETQELQAKVCVHRHACQGQQLATAARLSHLARATGAHWQISDGSQRVDAACLTTALLVWELESP